MINGIDELCTAYNTRVVELSVEVEKLKAELLEANRNIVNIDNLSLEESGYSYICDTHGHDDCGDCVVNNAIKYIKEKS